MGGSRQGNDRSTCGQHEATIRLGNGVRTGGLQGGSVVVVVVVATICSQCLFNHLKQYSHQPSTDRGVLLAVLLTFLICYRYHSPLAAPVNLPQPYVLSVVSYVEELSNTWQSRTGSPDAISGEEMAVNVVLAFMEGGASGEPVETGKEPKCQQRKMGLSLFSRAVDLGCAGRHGYSGDMVSRNRND